MSGAVILGRWTPGSDEWHAARHHGIGGSEIAPILGLSPFESRFSLWHRKAQHIGPIEDTPEMEWGRRLEPAITAKVIDTHPEWTFPEQGYTYSHPDRPWQIANPDLLGDELVEVKCSRYGDGWGDPGTDEVPIHYRQQVLWYMDCLGRERAILAVLVAGCDYREYVVTYDPVEAQQLRDAATAFLDTLERGEQPSIDEHTATYQAIRELHPDIDGTDIEVTDNLAMAYIAARTAAKEAGDREQHAKNLLADAMGTARRAIWAGKAIATRQARGTGLPYLVAGRNLPDITAHTPTEQDAA